MKALVTFVSSGMDGHRQIDRVFNCTIRPARQKCILFSAQKGAEWPILNSRNHRAHPGKWPFAPVFRGCSSRKNLQFPAEDRRARHNCSKLLIVRSVSPVGCPPLFLCDKPQLSHPSSWPETVVVWPHAEKSVSRISECSTLSWQC